ncbi:MAG: DUF4921 family protein [Planctomycetales bacterium]|nr:DUF4921 family protein [Planctomycetales bacterium]
MSPDSDAHLQADQDLPIQVNEAVAEFRVDPDSISGSVPNTIDTDTRLASTSETESMWPGRPARSSVIRSFERTLAAPESRREPSVYRGDGANSHTRRDLLTGDWTIFAPKRDERPNEYALPESELAENEATIASLRTLAVEVGCPFCSGAENQTPEAVWSAKLGELTSTPADNETTRFARPQVHVADGEQTDWDVRVVPNKFPAVSRHDASKSGQDDRQSLFPIVDVVGGHEVIIESAMHADSTMELDPALVYLTLMAYRDRIKHWRDVPGINYISVFKNNGREAGASLRHCHSQLVATSLMPQHVRYSLMRSEQHRARTGCTLGCDLLRAEIGEKSRVIDRTDSFVAFCPFASRFAGMIRVTSVAHQPYFESFSDASLDQLASFLWRVLSWVNQAFPGKAFNYLLHTCPPGAAQGEAFQWSLEIFPRLNKTAGFEWSSDCMINSMLPEAAASRYREIARRNDPRNVLTLR